jgi:hypothetical protein
VLCLLVTACTAVEEPARNVPIAITVALAAGQRVICETGSGRAGFPLATPSAAAIIFYQRIRIECYVVGDPGPLAPAKAKAPPK